MRWLDGITVSNGHEFEQASGVGDGQDNWNAAVHGVTKSRTLLSDVTELRAVNQNHWPFHSYTFLSL